MSVRKRKKEAVLFLLFFITPSIMMYNELSISEEFQYYCLHPSQLWCQEWHRTCTWRYPYRRNEKHRRSIPTLAHYLRLTSASIALLNTCKLSKLSEHGIFCDCIWSFYNGRRWYFFNYKNRAEISVPVHTLKFSLWSFLIVICTRKTWKAIRQNSKIQINYHRQLFVETLKSSSKKL